MSVLFFQHLAATYLGDGEGKGNGVFIRVDDSDLEILLNAFGGAEARVDIRGRIVKLNYDSPIGILSDHNTNEVIIGDVTGGFDGLKIVLNANTGLVHITNLPTSDPHAANALWNDDGTLKISSGV